MGLAPKRSTYSKAMSIESPALYKRRTRSADLSSAPRTFTHNGYVDSRPSLTFRSLTDHSVFPSIAQNIVKFSYLNIGAMPNNFLGFTNGAGLVFQKDGNFVMYKDGVAVAATASNSRGNNLALVFQADGNLVVYNGSTPLWATDTGGIAQGAELVIQDRSPYIQIVGKNGNVFYTANEK